MQFYCISRSDVKLFRPADHIDALYGDTLRRAVAAGVETLAWDVRIDIAGSAFEIELCRPVPIELS